MCSSSVEFVAWSFSGGDFGVAKGKNLTVGLKSANQQEVPMQPVLFGKWKAVDRS